ncbi:MAG: hypothetical protein AAF411_02415 [Myxococcota bacterium]
MTLKPRHLIWTAALATTAVCALGLAQGRGSLAASDFNRLEGLVTNGSRRVYLGRVQAGRSAASVQSAVRGARNALASCLRSNPGFGNLVVSVRCEGARCTGNVGSSSTGARRLDQCVQRAVAQAIQGATAARQAAAGGARVALTFATGSAQAQNGMGMESMAPEGMAPGMTSMGPQGTSRCAGSMVVPCGSQCCYFPNRCGDSVCHPPANQPGRGMSQAPAQTQTQ